MSALLNRLSADQRVSLLRLLTKFVVVFLFGLTGCTSYVPTVPSEDGSWFALAKFSLKSPDVSASGSLVWTQNGDDFNIIILSPLGGKLMAVERRGDSVSFTPQPDDDLQQPEYSIRDRLPLAEMVYWMRARPAPGLEFLADYDERDRLRYLEQSGWRINYRRYHDALPERLELLNGDLRLLLVVKEWR